MTGPTEYDQGIHRNTEILLQMIKDLEQRIIDLEKKQTITGIHQDAVDHWYWRFG